MPDYYKILGVDRKATDADIKTAYRELAKQYHPDMNRGDPYCESRFKEINEAYDVLKDSKRRLDYDLKNPEKKYDSSYSRNDPFSNWYDINEDWRFSDTDKKMYENIINDLHSKYYDRYNKKDQNRDVNINYSITLEEVHSGKKNVTLEISTDKLKKKIINFDIPAGIEEGAKIRLPGEGENHNTDAPPSDVYVTIKTTRHPYFIPIGSDLTIAVDIDYYDAIIGKKVQITGIDGNVVSFKIPQYVEPGKILRVSNEGLNKRGGGRGDLYINVNITPPKPDAVIEDIIRKFKEYS